MKALFIGGTGTISTEVSKLAVEKGWELYLLNRGNRRGHVPEGCAEIRCDIGNERETEKLLGGMSFDVVADFIVFTPEQLERDIRLFGGRTRQYIFISSATVYRKPPSGPAVTEGCVLDNPFWRYAQDKIACEEALYRAGRERGFPYTIVRPSHTYWLDKIPVALHGHNGSWQVMERMLEGKPVIVPGDGTTLWTLTHSSDFAKAFVALMGNPRAIKEAYHITSDEALTWNMVYQTIGEALGVTPELVHIPSDFLIACDDMGYDFRGSLLGDKANVAVFDNSRIKTIAPEFVCTTRFFEGVRMAASYIGARPELKRQDPEFDGWCDRVIAAYNRLEAGYKKHGM